MSCATRRLFYSPSGCERNGFAWDDGGARDGLQAARGGPRDGARGARLWQGGARLRAVQVAEAGRQSQGGAASSSGCRCRRHASALLEAAACSAGRSRRRACPIGQYTSHAERRAALPRDLARRARSRCSIRAARRTESHGPWRRPSRACRCALASTILVATRRRHTKTLAQLQLLWPGSGPSIMHELHRTATIALYILFSCSRSILPALCGAQDRPHRRRRADQGRRPQRELPTPARSLPEAPPSPATLHRRARRAQAPPAQAELDGDADARRLDACAVAPRLADELATSTRRRWRSRPRTYAWRQREQVRSSRGSRHHDDDDDRSAPGLRRRARQTARL